MSFVSSVFNIFSDKSVMVTKDSALKGRDKSLVNVCDSHLVLKNTMKSPFPSHTKWVVVGMGCFWGAERLFWKLKGVFSTHVGYAGGYTNHPTYEEVCTGKTGHTEVVKVIYEPEKINLKDLLKIFWEKHDPTTINRQGNDVGTQYRSAIYVGDEADLSIARDSAGQYQKELEKAQIKNATISTEIKIIDPLGFFYAEDYHQQYLHKNPQGYCSLKGTGVKCV